MRRCSVPGCYSNYTKPYVSVFTFPKDPELCKLWLKNIGRPTLKVHENIGVCIKHFEKHLIIGIDSSTISRKKLSIKYGSVPTIFEDVCSSSDNPKMEKKIQSVDKVARMQRKNIKSPSSLSDGNVLDKSDKLGDEKKETVKSPKKVSITTDRPIITVIKAEEPLSDIEDMEKSPEKMEVNENPNQDQSNSESPALASPFKNLQNVSVCLKEEDRVPVIRELKGVKRSSSTGSNSSTGSSDVQKSLLLMKRRKVEKPAPVVLGRQNDCYCWVCHRENISLSCIACPRAYHVRCSGEINSQLSLNTSDWVCPECQRILAAENVDTRSSTLAEISLDRLGSLLKLSLNKMKLRAPIAFHQPVSLDHYPKYLHYVIHPMDFTLLEKNIKQKVYGCTEAFLADVKWISHNSCVFNGTQHPLSTNAKNLVKSCDQDMQEIEVCPDCFVHSVVRNKYWFSEVCRKPHPLVWAKLKGFPYWPAKVVRIADGNVDARFFGAHDRAWVPLSQCYHLSKEMPTTSKPKKKGNYEVALDELNVHVHFLIQKFGCFEYAPCRTSFNPHDKTLMYHGIDIDKVSKEDIIIDSNPQRELNLLSFEKENRFASFLESECEKSNTGETRLSENQSDVQSSHITKKIESESPSFIIKQRISIDSVSEKEMPADELKSAVDNSVDESKDESKSTDEQISADPSKAASEPKHNTQMKKTDSSLNISDKERDKLSDSDQCRKLELALQRIKGYVSFNVDSEKENEIENEENVQNESNDKNKENEKNNSEVTGKDKTEKSKVLSPLFKESITLPTAEPGEGLEKVDVSVALETTKKTDSFLLKLSETIESCKAKLGISEIDDDLSSDESAIDDNVSRSDEDEDDETSASEAEVSEEEVDEDADEGESMEVSDEEVETKNKVDDAESDEEESDSQASESSDTDIESSNEISPKKIQKSNLLNLDNKTDAKDVTLKNNMDIATEDSIKSLTNDSNEAIITNPDMQVPEVTIEASGAMEIVGENSISESSNDIKENSGSLLNGHANKVKISTSQESIEDSISDAQSNSLSEVSKEESSNMECVEMNDSHSSFDANVNKNNSPFKNIVNNSSLIKNVTSPRENIDKKSEDIKPDIHAKQDYSILDKKVESPLNKNELEEEDDDDDEILICTPTRPKSPPVIVLDDDQENENSSASDTFAIKSPPYSTSVDSFSNEENPNCRTNSGDDPDNNMDKAIAISNEISHEEIIENNEKKVSNTNVSLDSKNTEERRKRKFSSGSSSDDDDDDEDIQVVTPVKKLTGAIRTFHKPNNNVPSLKPTTPTVESVKRNLERDSLNQISKSPVLTDDSGKEANSPQSQFLRSQFASPSIAEKLLKNPQVDSSNLSDKDKEILYLKSKLNCVLTAYQIQSWKCSQEREELRHNMNLVVMEMRACLESDKKQAIEAISKKFEQEKQKCIGEAKRKQWCASCFMESRYACCWNTSYCSIDCQKKHFPEHRHLCSQLKSKSEVLELKQKSVATNSPENSENKKLYILTKPIKPKPPDASQQISVNKPQIQVKQQLQIASSNSIANNIQFVLAPVKSTAESISVASTPPLTSSNSKEQSLNASHIMNQVRNRNCDLGAAITMLKRKNMEAIVSNLKKEEETKQQDANLEDIYFPSPPTITFEGYESATPDPNLILDNDDDLKDESIIDPDDLELPNDATLEPDVVLSDTDEKDNEMVNIGHGVEIKAKFLNKCLVYGQTAKKLTRCLVDVIFPDVKLLATCSAFGQKSNVTKLTRAALPSRKVHAIIDYVRKRFPEATRSEIVLQINMKCKEARVILSKRESEVPKKTPARRLLAREKEGELATTGSNTSNASSSSITSILTSPVNNIVSNVVCVKSTSSNMFSFNAPSRPQSVPNILRCNSQILIKPKPMSTVNTVNQPILNTVGKAAILQTPPVGKAAILQTPPVKRRETVRNLLAAKMNVSVGNLSKNAQKLVMAVDTSKPPTSNTQVVTSSATATNIRPYIIIGSQINPVKSPSSSTSTQNAVLPMSTTINK